jgi:hypothetical protein
MLTNEHSPQTMHSRRLNGLVGKNHNERLANTVLNHLESPPTVGCAMRLRIQSLAKVIAHLERAQFKWNDVYLATTTSGQCNAGTSPVATEPIFSFVMMKNESSWEMPKI